MAGAPPAPATGGQLRARRIFPVRILRNVAIVMLLALVVAFAPAGGNAADAVLTAITMGFLAAIAWTVFVLSRRGWN